MELARAGCDDDDIASYSGHTTKQIIQKHAGKVRQIMRAREAAKKRRRKRTIGVYLTRGAKVDPDSVDIDRDEAELDGLRGAAFDLVSDGMSGEYAVAGKIIARCDPCEGIEFQSIPTDAAAWRPEIVAVVRMRFPGAEDGDGFGLYPFSHFP